MRPIFCRNHAAPERNKKAHRRRRVVERGQKIGFDVIDLCRGCPQAVQNVGNVHLCELPEPLLDNLDGDLFFFPAGRKREAHRDQRLTSVQQVSRRLPRERGLFYISTLLNY